MNHISIISALVLLATACTNPIRSKTENSNTAYDTAVYNDDVEQVPGVVSEFGDSEVEEVPAAEDSGDEDTAQTHEEFCTDSFTILTGASAPSERVETEVVGLPYLEYDMPISNDIAQGDEATVRIKITALCGNIRIDGLVAMVVWSDNEYDWLVDLGQSQTPAELKNTATDSSDQEGSWVGTYLPNTNSWPWNFLSYDGYFAEDAVEYIESYTIEEGGSITYEFTFKDSSWVPVGDKFNMNFAYLFWTDLDGDGDPLVASTSPDFMPDGGLEWTGEELYGRSSGTFPSTVFRVVE